MNAVVLPALGAALASAAVAAVGLRLLGARDRRVTAARGLRRGPPGSSSAAGPRLHPGIGVVAVAVAVAGVLVAAAVVGWWPVVAAASLAAAAVVARRRHRLARIRLERDRALPELIDLFVLAGSAGHPVAGALELVATRAPPPLRGDVANAVVRFRRGLPLAEALGSLGRELGPSGVALTDALAHAAASGYPIAQALDEVAVAARDRRRRDAQEAAHRLPVTLLFPLTLCVLPAAILLAVVPVLAASLASLAP